MIPVSSLLYKLSQRLNKVGAAEFQSVPIEDQVLAIQEAEIKLMKQKIGTHNSYGTGFESFLKRYVDLENFVTTSTFIPKKVNKSLYTQILPDNFFLPIAIKTSCSKGTCKSRTVDVIKIVPHAEISLYLNSPHWSPSFAYQETLATIEENNLSIYTDGEFTIESLALTYLRYPVPFDAEGYEDFDGTPSLDSPSEYRKHLEDELLDLAVLNLSLSTNNSQATQASQIRLSNNE